MVKNDSNCQMIIKKINIFHHLHHIHTHLSPTKGFAKFEWQTQFYILQQKRGKQSHPSLSQTDYKMRTGDFLSVSVLPVTGYVW